VGQDLGVCTTGSPILWHRTRGSVGQDLGSCGTGPEGLYYGIADPVGRDLGVALEKLARCEYGVSSVT
jgi:hypothetical protein